MAKKRAWKGAKMDGQDEVDPNPTVAAEPTIVEGTQEPAPEVEGLIRYEGFREISHLQFTHTIVPEEGLGGQEDGLEDDLDLEDDDQEMDDPLKAQVTISSGAGTSTETQRTQE